MSDLTLIIGNKNYSSWSLRPWVFLRQNKITFNEKRVALFTETTQQELSAFNSDLKVPVLIDDCFEIWDSLSILEYLSEKYLNGKGWPAAEKARAVARSISSEMHSSFSHVCNELPMNCRKIFSGINLSADAQREIMRIQLIWRQCRSQYAAGGKWLFGEYSIADAMFAPVALRFAGYSIELDDNASAYVQTVLEQPAIIEWMKASLLEKEIIAEDDIEMP